MKKLIIFSLFINVLGLIQISGQDTIILNTKKKLEGKVMEVGINTIKYKKASNINGPLYSAEKKDIFLIIYENGTQESFENPEPNLPSNTTSSKPMESVPSQNIPIPPSAPIISPSSSGDSPSQTQSQSAIPQTEIQLPSTSTQQQTNLEDMLVPTGRYKLSSSNKEKMRKNDLDIYSQYKSGRRMKTIFGSISLASTGIFALLLVNDLAYFDETNTSATVISPPTLIFAGAGLLTSFLTKGPRKKIKRSYTNHNNDIKRQMNAQASWDFSTSKNGIGLVLSF